MAFFIQLSFIIYSMPPLDIINDVLEECIIAYPVSTFVISLYKQYMQRGSLSKKQLEGLYSKASKIQNIAHNKLATLEAVIKKMPTRSKSDKPVNTEMFQKDIIVGEIIASILTKYPAHKRVLFLKAKYENNEILSPLEVSDLKRLEKLLKV